MAMDQEIIDCAREGFDRIERKFDEIDRILARSRFDGLAFRLQMIEQRLERIERRLDLVEG